MTKDTITKTPKLLGYQFADAAGTNISGDDNDPSGEPSYRILSADEAAVAMKAALPNRYLLMPIFEGDIEEPALPDDDAGIPSSSSGQPSNVETFRIEIRFDFTGTKAGAISKANSAAAILDGEVTDLVDEAWNEVEFSQP